LEEKKLRVRNRRSYEVISGNVIMWWQTLKQHLTCVPAARSVSAGRFHTRGRSWNFKRNIGLYWGLFYMRVYFSVPFSKLSWFT